MRPLILVSNDDGIAAPGIRALVEAMAPLGDVVVAAPITEQSAVGHAITVRDPVRAHPWPTEAFPSAQAAFAVTGTPADCVKLALSALVPRRPALVVSGINNGPNTAVNVIYSGTVSAATEGTMLGIDSVAFSQSAWNEADYSEAAPWCARIAQEVLTRGLPPGLLLNVNLPFGVEGGIKGVRPTRQARARWEDAYEPRTDPMNQQYFWNGGRFVNLEEAATDTDLAAIDAGYVSVTPIHYDLTAHHYLDELGRWWPGAPVSETPGASEASSRR